VKRLSVDTCQRAAEIYLLADLEIGLPKLCRDFNSLAYGDRDVYLSDRLSLALSCCGPCSGLVYWKRVSREAPDRDFA